MATKTAEKSEKIEQICLVSSDNESVCCELIVAHCCNTIREMCENLGYTAQSGDMVVPLPNVTGHILKKVVEWATYHKDDPHLTAAEEEAKEKRTDDIPAWDLEFLKVDQGTLFEIILAANYLDVRGLLNVACKSVANMIKGKTPEEIRKTFCITNDFSPGEEEQIRKENEWCEEK